MSWHADGRILSVGGRRAHCVDTGRGPPVLLLHGFLHSSWTWRATVEALAPGHRVIAPDLPGFGWGDRAGIDGSIDGFTDWLEQLLGALKVDRLHAGVGNSLGGAVLLEASLRRPSLLGQLVLVSPLAAPLRVPALPLRLLGLRPFAPVFRLTAGNPRFVKHALRWTAYKRVPVGEEILRGFEPLRREGSHRSAVETARQLWSGSAALAKRLDQLTTPTTVVWGQKDRVLSPRYGRRVARLLPAARFVPFEDCGHCPQEEDPARFQRLVSDLLRPRASGAGELDDRIAGQQRELIPTPAGPEPRR